ncbi:unnamed protein product [Aphanomyces euteiches]|uniref:NOT2/NOT3/NOT5 C-terminal domain-containing protein n=1 Tax=Aphanomyces euteiches TaxID=100861 RepID=A0A6G0X2P9_9STRA|nr:hypothetical protein Ae201684_009227 [Aphanomyces euteiches]KAH9070557.1 hypothetical protein Ae201684P_002914 [Aphanomyces euteiches]KAH9114701.1 hypothetical protein AeMF1_011222 [Aphanomyces euteiches]KAH9123800.1 hypothetical protein LEN26_009821 [Aphanomyces euteiches]KAH9190670.1 hypothetical protein AeNC1_007348 [Aphanomyces euteiches]
MAGQRKLQSEIDRTLKKVAEGVEVFNSIWDKVYSAAGQAQKEKHEADLKKEIKKLQRFRDQIKTWISSSDVKDKRPLMETRRLIESKMEEFKVCEKETKTKAYSKEGLAQAERLDPAEQAKQNTIGWIQEDLTQFAEQIDSMECELERLRGGKGKKNKSDMENLDLIIARHKWHTLKLEQIARLLDNDAIEPTDVDGLKDDIDYYLEANQEPDFMDTYGEDDIYEALDLDSLSSIQFNANADNDDDNSDEEEATPPPPPPPTRSNSTNGRSTVKKPVAAAPIIGRAGTKPPEPVRTAPTPVVPPPMLKEPMAQVLRKEPPSQQPPKEQPQPSVIPKTPEREPVRDTPVASTQQPDPQPTVVRSGPPSIGKPRVVDPPPAMATASSSYGILDDTRNAVKQPSPLKSASPLRPPIAQAVAPPPPPPVVLSEERRQVLRLIDESFKLMPDAVDSDKGSNRYVPRNMYPTPASFPSVPAPLFENPAVFEKFDLDTLFFIFYYQQGTYQQYLAALQLKKQAWGYHKKYKTWFKRHEEPQMTGEDFEQGTFVYFDYETGWCQRIKTEFTFEYNYLEDELV